MNPLSNPAAVITVGATILLGGASGSLGGSLFAVIGAVIGALWGIGLAWLAGKLSLSQSRRKSWANILLFAAALIAGLVAGAGILAEMLMNAALDSQPQFFADMVRGPIGVAEALPFYLFNTPLEWLLLPSALLLTWDNPRRRHLVLAALIIWTCHRIWTYTYFVPQITWWSEGTPGTALTPEQLEQARTWVNLSAIRSLIDLATSILVLLAGFIPNTTTAPEAQLATLATGVAPDA